jgi:hypothetical protein
MFLRALAALVSALIPLSAWGQGVGDADAPEWSGMRVFPSEVFPLFNDKEIERELSITPEQRGAVDDLQSEFAEGEAEAAAEFLRNREAGSAEERRKLSEKQLAESTARFKEFGTRIWKTLNPAQGERMVQILRQLDAATALVQDDEVVARLNVTREQRLAVGEVMKQSRKNMADLRRGKNRDEYVDDLEAEEVRRSERALEALTGEQRTGWSELVGKPIDVASLRKRTNPIRHPMRLNLRQRIAR